MHKIFFSPDWRELVPDMTDRVLYAHYYTVNHYLQKQVPEDFGENIMSLAYWVKLISLRTGESESQVISSLENLEKRGLVTYLKKTEVALS